MPIFETTWHMNFRLGTRHLFNKTPGDFQAAIIDFKNAEVENPKSFLENLSKSTWPINFKLGTHHLPGERPTCWFSDDHPEIQSGRKRLLVIPRLQVGNSLGCPTLTMHVVHPILLEMSLYCVGPGYTLVSMSMYELKLRLHYDIKSSAQLIADGKCSPYQEINLSIWSLLFSCRCQYSCADLE